MRHDPDPIEGFLLLLMMICAFIVVWNLVYG